MTFDESTFAGKLSRDDVLLSSSFQACLRIARRYAASRSALSGRVPRLVIDVPRASGPPGKPLADRLDHLFRTRHPKDRGPFTPAEVATSINQAAGQRVISSTYVWQLRTGRRDNPTQRHLSALASFFGISPMYFFSEAENDQGAVSPEDRACRHGRPPQQWKS